MEMGAVQFEQQSQLLLAAIQVQVHQSVQKYEEMEYTLAIIHETMET